LFCAPAVHITADLVDVHFLAGAHEIHELKAVLTFLFSFFPSQFLNGTQLTNATPHKNLTVVCYYSLFADMIHALSAKKTTKK
jgi:hypothetical protein